LENGLLVKNKMLFISVYSGFETDSASGIGKNMGGLFLCWETHDFLPFLHPAALRRLAHPGPGMGILLQQANTEIWHLHNREPFLHSLQIPSFY